MKISFRHSFAGLLVLLIGSGIMQAADRPLVIAHRGASGYLPEHTLAAKAAAFAMGADYNITFMHARKRRRTPGQISPGSTLKYQLLFSEPRDSQFRNRPGVGPGPGFGVLITI